MKITGDRIHTQLSSLVNGSARNYLQDSVITMRNGRYCIPVKAEYKGQVPGWYTISPPQVLLYLSNLWQS